VAITWILILYIGIPIAILGSFVSYYLYKNHKNGDDVFENEKEFPIAAVIVAVASILIGIGSILGNIYDDDAPYNKFFRGASKNIEVSKSNTPVDDN
jgi:ABC-type glucose/galactose transport system permease subunit